METSSIIACRAVSRQPCVKALEEDEIDVEERIRRCQQDARQYLEVRPEMAWSRAQQAVTLAWAGPAQSAR